MPEETDQEIAEQLRNLPDDELAAYVRHAAALRTAIRANPEMADLCIEFWSQEDEPIARALAALFRSLQ